MNELPKTRYPAPLNQPENLALIGRMNASSMTIQSAKLPVFEAFRVNDESLETSWKANGSENEWLEIEWVKPIAFNTIIIKEEGSHIKNYKVQL